MVVLVCVAGMCEAWRHRAKCSSWRRFPDEDASSGAVRTPPPKVAPSGTCSGEGDAAESQECELGDHSGSKSTTSLCPQDPRPANRAGGASASSRCARLDPEEKAQYVHGGATPPPRTLHSFRVSRAFRPATRELLPSQEVESLRPKI
eukprot:3214336-Prymnesium_polylepis.1